MDSTASINIEDFMDVVYKCKFCPYTCTQSPDMGHHVKENHLLSRSSLSSQAQIPGTDVASQLNLSGQGSVCRVSLDKSVSGPLTHCSTGLTLPTGAGGYSIQDSDDVLSFTSENQAFMDKGLGPVSQPHFMTFSNQSTPDLSELISLVKPADDVRTVTNGQALTTEQVAQIPLAHSISLPNQPQFSRTIQQVNGSASLPIFNNSRPLTVIAMHVPNIEEPVICNNQFTVDPTPLIQETEPPALPIPENAETKEFLLCGLCKLAFTSMEDCQSHMQSEHRELMQGNGVSIGVQVGGTKKGKKRKTDRASKMLNHEDQEDIDWMPSFGRPCTQNDGRIRRSMKPPRALKDDYIVGKQAPKKRKHLISAQVYNITCPMMNCKARFKTGQSLEIHLSCHNTNDSAFTCYLCSSTFEFWKQLRLHLWKQHTVDMDLWACNQCSYKTDTQHKITIHKEIHTDEKPYVCKKCNKGFRQSSQLKNHETIHTSFERKDAIGHWFSAKTCDICERVFSNSKCLKKHKESVHAKFKPFKCSFCEHTTSRKAMMELHIRTHTGEKPYKCDVCSYSTGDHNSLRRHKMRHTGQKQYKCTLCSYTCIQTISLKQHMRHKHPGAAGGIFQCARCPFRTINQMYYENHLQDHKNNLICEKIVPQRLDFPNVKKHPVKSNGKKNSGNVQTVENLLMKHPQFHTVVTANKDPTTHPDLGDAYNDAKAETDTTEVFTMQVTMLPEGDTQVSAEDMRRLSESQGLVSCGVTPLQLIYATLSTISEQSEPAKSEEGRTSLLTVELMGGIHTSVLSSSQEGVTVHSVTYHLPLSQGGKDLAKKTTLASKALESENNTSTCTTSSSSDIVDACNTGSDLEYKNNSSILDNSRHFSNRASIIKDFCSKTENDEGTDKENDSCIKNCDNNSVTLTLPMKSIEKKRIISKNVDTISGGRSMNEEIRDSGECLFKNFLTSSHDVQPEESSDGGQVDLFTVDFLSHSSDGEG